VTSNKRLDYGANPDHDADPKNFKGNFHYCRIEAIVRILLLSQKVVAKFLSSFWCGSRNFLRNFCNCGVRETVTILSDQLPWRKYRRLVYRTAGGIENSALKFF